MSWNLSLFKPSKQMVDFNQQIGWHIGHRNLTRSSPWKCTQSIPLLLRRILSRCSCRLAFSVHPPPHRSQRRSGLVCVLTGRAKGHPRSPDKDPANFSSVYIDHDSGSQFRSSVAKQKSGIFPSWDRRRGEIALGSVLVWTVMPSRKFKFDEPKD